MSDAQNHRKIRVGRAWDAIAFPFANFAVLIKLALFPIIIAAVVGYFVLSAFWPAHATFGTKEDIEQFNQAVKPAVNIINIVLLLLGAMIAVGIHRFIIHGERPGWTLLRLRKYELVYVLAPFVFIAIQIGIIFIVLAAMIAIAYAVDPSFITEAARAAATPEGFHAEELPRGLAIVAITGFLVLFCLVAFVAVRLILMMPNAAVQGSLSPRFSWRAIRGNFWRFLLTMLVFALPLVILTGVLLAGLTALLTAGIASAPAHAMPPALYAFFALPVLIYFFSFPMGVALLSYIYTDLVGDPTIAATRPA